MSDPVDPFEAVKKFWGAFGLPLGVPGATPGASPSAPAGMGFGAMPSFAGLGSIPGMVMPSFDIAEVEKRIADLKSVESWLALNIEMVRTTIHGLEAQKATLGAFKAMQQGSAAAAAATVAGSSAPAPAPRKRRRSRADPKP